MTKNKISLESILQEIENNLGEESFAEIMEQDAVSRAFGVNKSRSSVLGQTPLERLKQTNAVRNVSAIRTPTERNQLASNRPSSARELENKSMSDLQAYNTSKMLDQDRSEEGSARSDINANPPTPPRRSVQPPQPQGTVSTRTPKVDTDAAFAAGDYKPSPVATQKATAGLTANRSDTPREIGAATAPRPAAPAPISATPKPQNPFEKYGANEPDAPASAFFRAEKEARASGILKEQNFEQFIRNNLFEQNNGAEKFRKKESLKIDIGGEKHDPTSPNKSHIEEDEQIDEITGTATSFGGRHKPRRSTAKFLAGKRLQRRSSLQGSGNQKRSPGIYEESTKRVMKKLKEKKEVELGSTDTNPKKRGETIDINPTKPELTTFH